MYLVVAVVAYSYIICKMFDGQRKFMFNLFVIRPYECLTLRYAFFIFLNTVSRKNKTNPNETLIKKIFVKNKRLHRRRRLHDAFVRKFKISACNARLLKLYIEMHIQNSTTACDYER